MKKIIIMMLVLMLPIVSAVGVVEYGTDLPLNTFLSLNEQQIRSGMDLTFNGTHWEEEQLDFYFEYWTVDGNFEDGFYIIRVREVASLSNELIYWCLDNYSVAQCQAGLLMLDEPYTINGYDVDPIVYQINTKVNDEVQYLLWLQDQLDNQDDVEDFVEGFEL